MPPSNNFIIKQKGNMIMKEKIRNWYNSKNKTCKTQEDDLHFYDIVIESENAKIDYEEFCDGLKEADSSILENDILEYYSKYEWLYDFLHYYKIIKEE